MRCSPKLCIGLLLLGLGGVLIWTPEGLSTFTPFLFVLACPLMCVAMMAFGRHGEGKEHHRRKHAKK